MQRRKRGNLQALAGLLEIPEDIVLDLPRITMLGNRQLLVENHKGIIEYTPEAIRIKLNQGEIQIQGKDLALGSMQVEQILIEGVITDLKYEG